MLLLSEHWRQQRRGAAAGWRLLHLCLLRQEGQLRRGVDGGVAKAGSPTLGCAALWVSHTRGPGETAHLLVCLYLRRCFPPGAALVCLKPSEAGLQDRCWCEQRQGVQQQQGGGVHGRCGAWRTFGGCEAVGVPAAALLVRLGMTKHEAERRHPCEGVGEGELAGCSLGCAC